MKISRRQFVQVLAVAGASALLTACGGSSNNSAAGSTAASGAAAAAGGSFNLKLGHNLAEDHAVHIQLTSFAEQVKEKTNGTVNIQIIPNGTLGSESDMISQIQAGALDMAKVSASTLGNFSEKYNAFSVPYVFDDQDHYYTYMDSDSAQAVSSARASKFRSGCRALFTPRSLWWMTVRPWWAPSIWITAASTTTLRTRSGWWTPPASRPLKTTSSGH